MTKISKIGVLGGAFNPPHFGHFNIAKKAIKIFGLKKLILMVAGKPPLKKRDLAPVNHRLAMAKIFAKLDPHFNVSEIEIKRARKGKKSYTIETIKELKKKYPNKEIYWIVGQDSLEEILRGKWRGGLRVLDEVKFVVFGRPGYKIKSKVLDGVKIVKSKIPISSTEIRKRLRSGQDVSKMVPKKILEYIKKRGLYL
jgi:nicotinate-nucleotide adenylyltransferase